MRFFISLTFCIIAHANEPSISNNLWKSKIDSLLPADPDVVLADTNLEIESEKYTQAKLYLVPNVDLFHSSFLNKENTSFKEQQYGLTANVNLFQFGRSHYNYLGKSSLFESEKIAFKQKKIQIENTYLLILFKNTLLQRRLSLFKQIENLKKKALVVAEQRFDRGNLPRQQVDKVEIDLNNLGTQRTTTERELFDSELDVLKLQLQDFKREWPFSEKEKRVRKVFAHADFAEKRILELKSESYQFQLESSRRSYLPQLDLSGRAYQWKQDQQNSYEWDLALKVTWPLWDNHTRSLANLSSYRDYQFWEKEKTRILKDWSSRVQFKDEQFDKLSDQVNRSSQNLKKLSALYADTEKLFSQGRITVNELFQDQQLLFETQINYENELYSLHQFILGYCEFHSQRVWDCF